MNPTSKFYFGVIVVAVTNVMFAAPREVVPLTAPTTPIQKQSRTALKHREPPTATYRMRRSKLK